jgi:hypothetical protein
MPSASALSISALKRRRFSRKAWVTQRDRFQLGTRHHVADVGKAAGRTLLAKLHDLAQAAAQSTTNTSSTAASGRRVALPIASTEFRLSHAGTLVWKRNAVLK